MADNVSTNAINQNINTIKRHYDGNNDIIPDTPRVTHTDMMLCYSNEMLLHKIELLEMRMRTLELNLLDQVS